MCGLQTRLLADANPQESWDPPSDADSLFTKIWGCGLTADPIQHLPVDSDADLWSKSMYWRGRNICGSAPLWSLCVLPGWARVNGIYDITIARHQMFVPIHKQNNYLQHPMHKRIRCESLSTVHTDHPSSACHECLPSIRSSVNNRLWKFKDRLRNNSSFTSLKLTKI